MLEDLLHVDIRRAAPFAQLLEVLGVGAKAEVHRAYHVDEARYVALKLLSVQARKDPEECVRFAREAKALSVTRHPALPELVECRTSPRRAQPYIAMALARGKRASEFCVSPRCLGPAGYSGRLRHEHEHEIIRSTAPCARNSRTESLRQRPL